MTTKKTEKTRKTTGSAGGNTPARVGPSSATVDLGRALVTAFLTSERVNQELLDMLEPRIWRLTPPCSQRRNIATTFSHIHNVRCMAARGARSKAPLENLDRTTVTMDQARKALAASARAMAEVIAAACAAGGKVPGVPMDAALFTSSALAHEAHHRGQVCHWARELGAPIQDQFRLWEWHKRAREVE